MRGRYVVLVVLIVAVWWMHRPTPDAEAVAPPASTPTKTMLAPRTFVAPTPRPELPPEPARAIDKPLPVVSPNTIHGRVTSVTGEPIHGVLVSLDAPTGWLLGVTDDDGYYAIHDVPAGRYATHFSSGGHHVVVEVPVSDDVPTESFAALDLDEQLPVANSDIDGRGIEYPVDVDEPEEPIQLDEVNEHPMRYNDPEIDWD